MSTEENAALTRTVPSQPPAPEPDPDPAPPPPAGAPPPPRQTVIDRLIGRDVRNT